MHGISDVDIDAERTQVKIPVRLVVAITAAFIFWWISTYVIPISDEIIKLKEQSSRDKAEHEALDARISASERRIDRAEDRLNAK